MAIPQVPDFWPMPLGSNADTVEIPDTTPAGEGIPSFTSLFPVLTQIDPTAGGVFIQRTWMNGLFQLLGNNIWYLQHGCLFPWNSTFEYPVGAHVLGSDSNEYVAVQENTGQDPTQDDGKKWKNVTSFLGTAFLPLAGGTMTGPINFGASSQGPQWTCANGEVYAFRAFSPDSIMQLVRTSGDVTVAVATFYPNGNIDLIARNGSQKNTLSLSPAGNLVWGNEEILTNGDVFTQTAQTNSITLPAGGTWNWLACGVTVNGENTSTVTGSSPGGAVVDLGSNITTISIIAIQVG